jgi:hypothetical protein
VAGLGLGVLGLFPRGATEPRERVAVRRALAGLVRAGLVLRLGAIKLPLARLPLARRPVGLCEEVT